MPPERTVVLLDALGTLLALEQPGPHLVRELAGRGMRVTPARAATAMEAEMAYYRAEHHRAGTPAGLAALRRACARVVLDALGPEGAGAGIADVEAALLASVRFAPYPDVPPALARLREDGAALVVVSNWDVSLHAVLEQTGLDGRVDAAISSAEAGVAKPDPAFLRAALALVGGRRERAWMVGDSVATDVVGAQRAGVRPVLVARGAAGGLGSVGAGEAAPPGVPVLPSFAGLPELVRGG